MRSLMKDNINGVVVEVTLEVKFIQSTMFRYLIESSTTVEGNQNKLSIHYILYY